MFTKLGIHVNQGSRRGYGDVARAAPAAVVALEAGAFDECPPSTIKIWRTQTVHNHEDAPGDIDHISEQRAFESASDYWGAKLWEKFKPVHERYDNVYFQPVNETGGRGDTPESVKSLRNVLAYERGLMAFFEAKGARLALTGFAGDSPDWQPWVDRVVPHLERGRQGGHLYCRHAYGGVPLNAEKMLTMPDGSPSTDNTARPFEEAVYLASQGVHIPIVIGEAGQNGGVGFAGTDQVMADYERFDKWCLKPEHYLIVAFCAWTYGDWMSHHPNIEAASDKLARYLKDKTPYQLIIPVTPIPEPAPIEQPTEPPKEKKKKLNAGINVGHFEALPATAVSEDGKNFQMLEEMQLAKFDVIRFMDWQKINNNPARRWSDLPHRYIGETEKNWKYEEGAWDEFLGVPLEIIIKCANHFRARPWLCIPHRAKNKLMRQMVTYAIDNAEFPPIFEFSNELWNNQFDQHHYAVKRGGLENPTYSFIAFQASQTQKLIEMVGDDGDVVISGQAANLWIAEQLLQALGGYRPAAVAVAPYFGQGISQAADAQHLHQQIVDFIDAAVLPACAQHKALADQAGVALWSYEWGQHLNAGSAPLKTLFQSYNRSRLAGAAYQRFMDGWRQLGGGLHCAYSIYSGYDNQMWGLWELTDGKAKATPKWQALVDNLESASSTPKSIPGLELASVDVPVPDDSQPGAQIVEAVMEDKSFIRYKEPEREMPALLREILANRYMPQSAEISLELDGERWLAQAARPLFVLDDALLIFAIRESEPDRIYRFAA